MKTETEQAFSSAQLNTADNRSSSADEQEQEEQEPDVTSSSTLTGYTPWQRNKRSWAELREDVRDIRRRLWNLGSRVPHSFTFRRMTGKTRVYFMSSPPNSRDNSVFAIDVPDASSPVSNSSSKGDLRFPWIQIISSDFQVYNKMKQVNKYLVV